jgi:putative nucleotidyltransferase with HDIG domain
MDMHLFTLPPSHESLLTPLAAFLKTEDASGWLVGGAVRDLLRGHPGADLDVAVDGAALDLARRFADLTGGAWVPLDEATNTARVVWTTQAGPFVLDLVRLRAPTIEDDLRLRDFTINALALPLDRCDRGRFESDALLDPTGGFADLMTHRVIRLAGPYAFFDDPLRTLRAVRLGAQLGFTIDSATDQALRQDAPRIAHVAQERVRDELIKLLSLPRVAPWLGYMDETRLLTAIIPELEASRDCDQPVQHFLPVLDHLLESVAAWEWLYGRITAQARGAHESLSDPHESLSDPHESLVTSHESSRDAHESLRDAHESLRGDSRPFALPAALRAFPDLQVHVSDPGAIVERMRHELATGVQRYAIFKFAVLLHDLAKPQTKAIRDGRVTFYDHQTVGAEMAGAIARRLRLGRESTHYLQLIIREHMRPGQLRALGADLTRRAVFKLLRDVGESFPDVLLHGLVDHLAARGPYLSLPDWQYHLAWVNVLLGEEWRKEPARAARLVSGTDLIETLELEPGPLVGKLLAAIDEAQFAGEVRTREAALALAEQIVREEQPGGD